MGNRGSKVPRNIEAKMIATFQIPSQSPPPRTTLDYTELSNQNLGVLGVALRSTQRGRRLGLTQKLDLVIKTVKKI